MRVVRVGVPVPALDSLTYSVPPDCDVPAVGARVLVPLGSRVLTGCVVDGAELDAPPAETIKPIIEILDATPFLPDDVVRLAVVGRRVLRLRRWFGAGCRDAADVGVRWAW